LVVLGLHHEQQHQELFLADLKYIFACNPLFPVYDAENVLEEKGEFTASETAEFVEINNGIYEIGYDENGFCFDNELGRHKVYLHDFSISKNPVTNGEFLKFIEAGGYENFNLWHSEGWDWVQQNEIKNPLYWHHSDGEWFQFTLSGLRRVLPENPVCHVSFYEAAAFAEWKNLRLPTEFEWEAASAKFGWGTRWEWTNSAYLPYPNFKKAAGAIGEYNGKFMINQMVLRGASVATPPNHSRPTYRNFFHPHLRWQFTGIRLAK
jgi:ergothioneine biosynthesis protein EgtB